MAESFDMSGALRFDLSRGRVSLSGSNERSTAQVVLPADALTALWRSLSPAQLKDFGHSTGTILGARVAGRLGTTLQSVEPREVVEHLGGELAISGLGSLTMESWGRALVFAIVGAPLGGDFEAERVWLGAVLESALTRLFSRDLEVVSVKPDGASVRFFVCNRSAGDQLRDWMANGASFGQLVERLNEVQS